MGAKELLVVVDMQPFFGSVFAPGLLEAVQREIKKAMRRQWPILIIEYGGCGPTHESLKELYFTYEHSRIDQKAHDDGSHVVERAILNTVCDSPLVAVRVCGIHAMCCVYWTAIGTAQRFPHLPVKVLVNACDPAHDTVWAYYNRIDIPNLTTIPTSVRKKFLNSLAA